MTYGFLGKSGSHLILLRLFAVTLSA